MIFLIFFGADFNFPGNLPYVKGIKSPSHQRVKTDFKKIFPLGGIFRIFLEFTLRWKEETNLSHQRKVKTRMKIFIQNQCIIKKLKNFSFFGDEKSNSGIFTIREGNKKPLPHEMVKRSFNMQKQLSKKNLFFLRENSSCREFTLWWKEETNLSHQRKVKTRMKIFIQNQCVIKKLKNFSFFWGDFDLSGIFTLCNKKIIFK